MIRIILLFVIWGLMIGYSPADASVMKQIDFEDAPIVGVIQTLAKSAGFDLVMAGEQTYLQNKKATIHLKEIEPGEAIELILRTNGFNYEKKGKAILISALPQDLNGSAYKTITENIKLKHLTASRTAELLGKLFPTVLFQPGSRANSLVIRGREGELEEIRRLVAEIDKSTPQVLIEGRVVELASSDSAKIGISYNNGIVKFVTNKDSKKTSLAENLYSTLNALLAEGRANIIASPRIATLDNQEALINIGSRIPYAVPVTSGTTTQWTVDYIDAGVKLKIIPQLGQDGDITTFIQPEVSSISEWRTTPAGDFPVISTRNASSTVRIKNGETIIIGGLLSEGERENISRVPILGYLPLVGFIFSNRSVEKEKTEIVFLITPYII
ncbi:hypothetical protein A2311_04565 [candidate division WOR-1 bacterium RIFOXYB2_FULL_48_7]|uniref:Secretin/TonB short N-terminal domain-containing protein n=1 Tax=candidate division WOR-1 bacterium RIFOXYB2_FULL_48_7 TaxID=1802583 RepID=A0A1F4TS18_UNCSA|nr:MAG: hypothetical protein A2311_04565 [candidate division WOR-1 bacterium RIFOXYB2_FULL_48_7]